MFVRAPVNLNGETYFWAEKSIITCQRRLIEPEESFEGEPCSTQERVWKWRRRLQIWKNTALIKDSKIPP